MATLYIQEAPCMYVTWNFVTLSYRPVTGKFF